MNKLIKAMNKQAVQERLAAIGVLLDGEGEVNATELNEEVDLLLARRKEIDDSIEERSQLHARVLSEGSVIVPARQSTRSDDYGLESVSYRNAFLKTLRGMELNELEQRAYEHNTTNSKALIPTEMENRIYSNMEEAHPILKDVRQIRAGGAFSITKHVSIKSGDAKVVLEGEKNEDEQNDFVSVTLVGKKISKHLEYTYELEAMAMGAFQDYVEYEIAERIGAAQADQIIAQIKRDLNAANKIDAKVPGTLSIDDYLNGLASLKGAKRVTVYASNATIYGHIARLKGDDGQKAFLPNQQDEIAGYLVGKGIKEEDSVADGELLILDPNQYLLNIVKPIELLRDREIKSGSYIVAGHSLTGGSMTNDKAGAIITVGTAI